MLLAVDVARGAIEHDLPLRQRRALDKPQVHLFSRQADDGVGIALVDQRFVSRPDVADRQERKVVVVRNLVIEEGFLVLAELGGCGGRLPDIRAHCEAPLAGEHQRLRRIGIGWLELLPGEELGGQEVADHPAVVGEGAKHVRRRDDALLVLRIDLAGDVIDVLLQGDRGLGVGLKRERHGCSSPV